MESKVIEEERSWYHAAIESLSSCIEGLQKSLDDSLQLMLMLANSKKLLNYYISEFVRLFIQNKKYIQTFILSKLRCFRRKVVDNLFIQSFISHFTRQSIQLLPAS